MKSIIRRCRIYLNKNFNLNQTDFRRWSDINKLSCGWESRNPVIASMIEPNSKILEFGAGTMTLPKYLPENCTYIPSDIFERVPGILVCDLNAGDIPLLPKVDVVAFSGVLEYINDVQRIINHLQGICNTIVASYAICTMKKPEEIKLRRSAGWINDYTEEEFLKIFRNSGFVCVKKTTWTNQIVCKFIKTSLFDTLSDI
jgi:hypothetical protein